MTLESILSSLITYGGLLVAHDVLPLLLANEFPEGHKVFLLKEANDEISTLPYAPADEYPGQHSREQITTLLSNYTVGGPMFAGRDYKLADRRIGLWKWKTRTVRMAGVYLGDGNCFVVARVGFAKGLKRGGTATVEREAEFAQVATHRLETLGLLTHAWKGTDPHYDQTNTFDPDS